MTQANRGIQGAVENLIEIAHMQREGMDAGFTKLTAAQTELTQTVNNLGQSVESLGVKIDKLTDRIDTLSQVTNAQQVIASQQAATVDKLVGLVTTLATKS